MTQFLGRSPSVLFATRALTAHVIRGAVAFALLYLAIEQQHRHPVASSLGGLLALVAMRGCPVCWTIGLAETIRQRHGVTRSRGVPPSPSLQTTASGLMKGRLE
jgi:ABC-type taurine transport system ATPase subunit